MTNRQLAAVLVTVILLAAMGCALALALFGGEFGMTLLYEIGGGLAGAAVAVWGVVKMLPDRDGDGVPDALQRSRRRKRAKRPRSEEEE